ncbi:MAG TPA: acetamidase [Chloroflexi bacterium]|jgi:amidase|nr:acetamidase [Chloroflexota bacterium]
MIHRYDPTHYYNTFGPHEPALRVSDGDTIITTTLDARGRDAGMQELAERPNPLTGPFYIEGAEPGDMLRVVIEAITPNREYGWCGTTLAPHVVDAPYARELPEAGLAEWQVNAAENRATLVSPETHLGRLTLPLEPMLGCLGVAPARKQAISSSTSGPYGGNMDYRGLAVGTTAYFPVFEPGALLFVGDGHAVQGDGEIVGMGIEISMDVQFTVHLIKGRSIGWPRAEDAEWIMTMGNARPLDQALQHATTEMMAWLQTEYGLDVRGASILLGQCVRYEVGNVFDPAYTVVCKLARTMLPRYH